MEYDGVLFPGEVKSVAVNNEYEVSVMVKAGAYWKWPKHEDKIYYEESNIKKKLAIPKLINARGHYDFCDFTG